MLTINEYFEKISNNELNKIIENYSKNIFIKKSLESLSTEGIKDFFVKMRLEEFNSLVTNFVDFLKFEAKFNSFILNNDLTITRDNGSIIFKTIDPTIQDYIFETFENFLFFHKLNHIDFYLLSTTNTSISIQTSNHFTSQIT